MTKFIDVIENIFEEEGEKHHEINFVYEVELGAQIIISVESHLDFVSLNIEQFKQSKIYPLVLRDAVIKWFGDGKFFLV